MEWIVLHHSETKGGDVRFIRHIHVHDNGWRDVGYHYVLPNGKGHGDWPAGKDGEIQKGRHLDHDQIFESDEYGAHAKGFNRESIGICLIGDFQFSLPTQKQIGALIGLLEKECRRWKLDPMKAIIGHRDLNNTLCPGAYFYNIIPALRWTVKRVMEYHDLQN